MNNKSGGIRRFSPALSRCLAVLLAIIVPITSLAADGYKVTYDGGSIPEVKTGAQLRLFINSIAFDSRRRKRTLLRSRQRRLPKSAMGRTCIAGSERPSGSPSFHSESVR